MRVAIVAESFLPNINGVTNSVLRVLEYLHAEGHDAVIIAPGARDGQKEVPDYLGFPIYRVPTIKIPLIDSLPIGFPTFTVERALRNFHPDIIHLASPFVLGAAGAFAARQLRIPAVAVYQTDVPGFATRYQLSALVFSSWEWLRTIHNTCQMTLAPSTRTIADLEKHHIKNIRHWGRGVDAVRFHPSKRCDTLRASWDFSGKKKIVGFVGRLAAEKGVHRLAALNGKDDIQLVIVGDGPEREVLEAALPNAVFTGILDGEDLARAYASLDVFVHTGEFETFCQAIQEAQASGVPTIAPRAGGPVDLITNGDNGYLLDIETFMQDLPAAIDAIDNRQFAKSARDAIKNKSWDALCRQLFGYYEEAIESTRRVPLTILGQRPQLPRWAARALGARVA